MIRNAPLLDDGTPMPTRYWLVDPECRHAGRRGSSRPAACARPKPRSMPTSCRRRTTGTRAERDAAIPAGSRGPAPHGGVGGTRRGVKCLHAHYAWYLAGGDDPVGRWVAAALAEHDSQ